MERDFYTESVGLMSRYTTGMTEEQILLRRKQLHEFLQDTEWRDILDTDLDKVRLTYEGNGYVLDMDGTMYFLYGKRISEENFALRSDYAKMPLEFCHMTGKDFNWELYSQNISELKELVNLFIMKFELFREKGMGLYIESSTKGSGKTLLSCCILNELIKRYNINVRFINCLDLLELIQKTYRGMMLEELDDLYTASVLVIDDIGVQMSKEWIDTAVYRLVNTRYSNRLVTIYTSNLSVNSLNVDDRIIDRIDATTYRILLPNEAIRSQKRAAEKKEIINQIRAQSTITA